MSFGGSRGAFIAGRKRGGYAGGPKRAAFWRALGFPNLIRARRARWRNHVPIAKQRAAKAFTPLAMIDDLPIDRD